MAVRIRFDNTHNVISPTLVLATRSGKKMGVIPALNVSVSDNFNSHFELEFSVYKTLNGQRCAIWDDITDFKLVWCKEWDVWFEMYVSVESENATVKHASCVSVGEAELSQVLIHDTEINTEDDIARGDYAPTVLYNPANPKASLLHRIMEKVPNYTVTFVDEELAKMQRTFTFDNISLYDAFQEIAEELDCIFVIDSSSADDGSINRTIQVYDLENRCVDCGARGEFFDTCPECGGTVFRYGYGDETNIFVSTDNLADNINLTTDTGSVKNCFRLETGDDLMTATVINCNPNGSQYIWYISDDMKKDMSDALSKRLDQYNALFNEYQRTHGYEIPSNILSPYNALVDKYIKYDDGLKKVSSPIVGYPALMNAYYDTISLYVLLHDTLMPAPEISGTNAQKEAAKITASAMSPLAVQNVKQCSEATASNAALALAKTLVDKSYMVKVASSSLSGTVWTGSFTVTSYADSEDTATSATIRANLTDDYQTYLKQRIEKILKEGADDTRITGIADLFALSLTAFKVELQKYCLNSLQSFADACQSCLDILIEQGVADGETWADQNPNLYSALYYPYYEKYLAIQDEILLRESEIATVVGEFNADGDLIADGMQTVIESHRDATQKTLDFESYLGSSLVKEFASYRREDTYSNTNYISDGLNNAELFDNARDFLAEAQSEIYKAATKQHSLSANLKNLLVMKEFEPIVNMFAVGNWIRIKIDDKIYRLRLLSYTINFDDLSTIDVEFSDVLEYADGLSDVESVLKQAASIATTYDSYKIRAMHGEQGNKVVERWVDQGLSLTNQKIMDSADNQTQVWDSHGMLFREYEPAAEAYSDTQLKIVNSTLAITDDNWRTIKTAIGKFFYVDPETGDAVSTFGVNGETIVGKLLLGQNLELTNAAGSMKFNENGLTITNGINTFTVNPANNGELLKLSSRAADLLWVDSKGILHIRGEGLDLDLSTQLKDYSTTKDMNAAIEASAGEIKSTVSELEGQLDFVRSEVEQLPHQISLSVSGSLGGSASIDVTVDGTTTSASGSINLSTVGAGGTVTFSTGQFIVNSGNFQVNANGKLTATGAEITGKITATSGSIGGWTIDSNSIYTGSVGSNNSAKLSISNFTMNVPGTTTQRNDWRFTVGSKFGVTNTGVLYATDVIITGTTSSFTFNGGAIAGFTVVNNTSLKAIYSGMTSFTDTTHDGVYLGTNGIALGHGVFKVTSAGVLTATNATITGTITATAGSFTGKITASSGSIGGFTITGSSIYSGVTSVTDTAHDGVYLGTNGIVLGKGVFKVTSAGVLTATNVNISGTINASAGSFTGTVSTSNLTATGGTIAGWTISSDSLYTGYNALDNLTPGSYFGKNGIRFTVVSSGGSTTDVRIMNNALRVYGNNGGATAYVSTFVHGTGLNVGDALSGLAYGSIGLAKSHGVPDPTYSGIQPDQDMNVFRVGVSSGSQQFQISFTGDPLYPIRPDVAYRIFNQNQTYAHVFYGTLYINNKLVSTQSINGYNVLTLAK